MHVMYNTYGIIINPLGYYTIIMRYMFQLQKSFMETIDDPMNQLGYCCGQQFAFKPLPCSGTEGCLVKMYAQYYCYKSGDMTLNFCTSCYSILTEYIDIGPSL